MDIGSGLTPCAYPLGSPVDGRNFGRVLRKTSAFVTAIEEAGFLTTCPDDVCLMSQKAGIELREFRDEARESLFVGDAARVAKLVARINANV